MTNKVVADNIKKLTVVILLTMISLLSLSSCNKGEPIAKIYQYADGERTKLLKDVYEEDEVFLIDMINNYYSLGNATGIEEPNFAVVYNEGDELEYVYLLIVDLETDVITMITDTYDETMAPKLLNSNTTALEFYDFLAE